LTDGKSWTFYFIRDLVSTEETGYELYLSKNIITDTDENIAVVMGIIIHPSELTIRITSSSLR
jgi:hypothetical protein